MEFPIPGSPARTSQRGAPEPNLDWSPMRATRYAAAVPALATLALLAPAAAACGPPGGAEPAETAEQAEERRSDASNPAERALRLTLERSHALADSIEDLLRPVPLMRPAEEASLRQYGQSTHLPRARSLGVRPSNDSELEAARREGRLVPLEDSTRYWVVREMSEDGKLVTPDLRALLQQLGMRFQERLAGMGLPPYRLEVTSAFRSAATQARLRRTNVNAAQGVSTHEFGTTVDLGYFTFPPPAELPDGLIPEGPDWMAPYLDAVARSVLESVSARKQLELKKVLGDVLREAQSDGLVLVTLERLQPVYHITVAGRLADS